MKKVKVSGWVYCDYDGEIHRDELNVYGYENQCSDIDHRKVYVKRTKWDEPGDSI